MHRAPDVRDRLIVDEVVVDRRERSAGLEARKVKDPDFDGGRIGIVVINPTAGQHQTLAAGADITGGINTLRQILARPVAVYD